MSDDPMDDFPIEGVVDLGRAMRLSVDAAEQAGFERGVRHERERWLSQAPYERGVQAERARVAKYLRDRTEKLQADARAKPPNGKQTIGGRFMEACDTLAWLEESDAPNILETPD